MTSEISLVMFACRTRLYCCDRSLIISPAFSVAPFMATRRAICSLTAASRKHLNSRTLNDIGRISSRMPAALGRYSYSTGVAEFIAKQLDRVEVAYMKFINSARQTPVVQTLL